MFLKYITLFSGFNYIVFAITLLVRKSPIRKANRFLGILFVVMSVYSIMLSFSFSALHKENYTHLVYYAPYDLVLLLLLGPLLLRYIRELLGIPTISNLTDILIHLLPFIPSVTFIVYFLLQGTSTRLNLLITNYEKGIWQINLLNLLFYFQMIAYLILSYNVIHKQLRKTSKVQIGNIQLDVSWLRIYIIINLSFMLLSAPLSFYFANEKVNVLIAQVAMIIQFIYLFVKSTWQTSLFSTEIVNEVKNKDAILKIADEVVEDYFLKLMDYINEKKPYLNEGCSIQSVSDYTGISVHHLSNILNNHFHKNFPDFINEYRTNEAKRILESDISNKMTLEAVGFECGFGSKSSFNKAFKKNTSLTPSEYRLQSRNN